MTPVTDHSFSIVVAMDGNRGIGIQNQLAWHLPEDMAFFKRITTDGSVNGQQNAVVMGRATFESIPDAFRPLPNRRNIVLTRNPAYQVPDAVVTAASLDSALAWAVQHRCPHIFIIGGAQAYNTALQYPACHKLFITEIDDLFDCDAFFPDFGTRFHRVSDSEWAVSKTGLRYRFTEWIRST